MISILVTGAGGQLGTSFREISDNFPDYDFYFATEEELDITNLIDVTNFFRHNKFNVIINCAAYTAVDRAESEPEIASLINAGAVKILAETAKRYNSFIVHFSTDYVFRGDKGSPYNENDTTDPVTIYGKTKLEGEEIIKAVAKNFCIIRTSWLYSQFGNNFVKTMMRLGNEKKELQVVNDQYGSPTYAPDLADAVLQILPALLDKKGADLYHYCNTGFLTWYDFASEIMKIAGLKCIINPISTDKYPATAKRPQYSVMDNARFASDFKIAIPGWKESLIKCINKIQNI